MTSSQPAADPKGAAVSAPRPNSTRAALLIGLPLAVGVLLLIRSGVLQSSIAERYVSHPVEWAEVILFCCALGALGSKLRQSLTERRAGRVKVLPPWDGQPVAVSEADGLLAGVQK